MSIGGELWVTIVEYLVDAQARYDEHERCVCKRKDKKQELFKISAFM